MNWLLKIFNKFGVKGIRKSGKAKQILNLQKDPNDVRDYSVRTLLDNKPDLPIRYSIKQFAPPVKQQGNIGSCGAHGGANVMEILYKKRNEDVQFSELWLYYKAREVEGWTDKDSGVYLRDICKVLTEQGISLEQYWPYVTSKFKEKPPWQADMCGKLIKATGYYRVTTITEIEKAVFEGYPVMFGVMVDKPFLTNRDGRPNTPVDKNALVGGHCMTITGYDSNMKRFEVLNSWGTGWGDQGYCWLPYDWITKYLIDAWVIQK